MTYLEYAMENGRDESHISEMVDSLFDKTTEMEYIRTTQSGIYYSIGDGIIFTHYSSADVFTNAQGEEYMLEY